MRRLPVLQTLAVLLAVIGTAKGAEHFRGFSAEARPLALPAGAPRTETARAQAAGPETTAHGAAGGESAAALSSPAAPVMPAPGPSGAGLESGGSEERLSQIYAAVPPETAARILAGLPPEDAARILLSMREGQAAQVLSAMDTEAAVALTLALSGKDSGTAR